MAAGSQVGGSPSRGWHRAFFFLCAPRSPLVSEGISFTFNGGGFLTTALQADGVSDLASSSSVIQVPSDGVLPSTDSNPRVLSGP